MTVLVTGATGAVGRLILDELREAGIEARAMTRSPETAKLPETVTVVRGDFGDPGSITADMFAGVDAVFVFPSEQPLDHFVTTALAAGVSRFVVLSSLAVSMESVRDAGSASQRHHQSVEDAVTSRTARWTMLRPGTFANNLLSWARPIAAASAVSAPYITSAQTPIHEADVAAVAAIALTQAGHEGKVYELTGPESLTRVQQVAAIAGAIGREIAITEISPDQFRAEVSRFIPADVISMLLDYWHDTVDTPDVPKPTVAQITGRPGRTLAQWAADHRAAFS